MGYDLCTLVESVRSYRDYPTLFPRARKRTPGTSTRGTYDFAQDEARFSLGRVLGGGATGRIYEGTFGVRPVVVKVNQGVTLREDVNEALMQTRLYCHLLPNVDNVARVPETLFAATVPHLGRVLGMARMDRSLLAHVGALTTPRAQRAALYDALCQVARLLVILQNDLTFMHGDLHGENVMCRGRDIYVIDFGMATARFDRHTPRMVTNDRYHRVPFHPHLDMLTLLTALREDLSLNGHAAAAAWCGAYVQPFWDTVRAGLFSGKVSPKLRYGAHRTVRVARDEISSSGEIYYAHHLLYEDIGPVWFPPCDPRIFLKRASPHAGPPLSQTRIFEDA